MSLFTKGVGPARGGTTTRAKSETEGRFDKALAESKAAKVDGTRPAAPSAGAISEGERLAQRRRVDLRKARVARPVPPSGSIAEVEGLLGALPPALSRDMFVSMVDALSRHADQPQIVEALDLLERSIATMDFVAERRAHLISRPAGGRAREPRDKGKV